MSRYAAIKRDPRSRKRPDGTRRRPRYLHVSAGLVHVVDPETGLRRTLVARPGKTYRAKRSKIRQVLKDIPGRQRRILLKKLRRDGGERP